MVAEPDARDLDVAALPEAEVRALAADMVELYCFGRSFPDAARELDGGPVAVRRAEKTGRRRPAHTADLQPVGSAGVALARLNFRRVI